jgi:class 3 adenylate cyclase
MKGAELEATILFADITNFSARTLDLTPMETLSFVNNFFAWIAANTSAYPPRPIGCPSHA